MRLTKSEHERLEIYKMMVAKIWHESAIKRCYNVSFVDEVFDSGWKAAFEALALARNEKRTRKPSKPKKA